MEKLLAVMLLVVVLAAMLAVVCQDEKKKQKKVLCEKCGVKAQKEFIRPIIRYFINVRGFKNGAVFVSVYYTNHYQYFHYFYTNGDAEDSPTLDLDWIEFAKKLVKDGEWKEITEKEAMALLTKTGGQEDAENAKNMVLKLE